MCNNQKNIRMKTISRRFLIVILILFIYSLNAQTFIRVDDSGWFYGGGRTAPTFTDLDFDGLYDLIIGNYDGNLIHYEQQSSGSTIFVGVSENFSSIDVGSYSTPVFTNIDNDGLKDLIIGNLNGTIDWYEQDTPGATSFTNTNVDFGITVPFGSSTPTFTDIDNDNLLDMVIGRHDGKLSRYEQAWTNSQVFNLVSDYFASIDIGYSSAPYFIDIDGDNLLDLLIGTSASNSFWHFEQNSVGSTSFTEVTTRFINNSPSSEVPTFKDIDNDGLLDLFFGEVEGNIYHYEQQTSNSYSFDLVNQHFSGTDIGEGSSITSYDIDNDGLIDIIYGARYGLHHFEQITSNSEIFEYIGVMGPSPGTDLRPTFTDLNNDGLLDLLIGYKWGLSHYVQDSPGSSTFNYVTNNFSSINVGLWAAPCFTDIDNDGLLDLLIGEYQGAIHLYEQSSSDPFVFNLITDNFCSTDFGDYISPTVTDIEGDGTKDLIVGCNQGTFTHYKLYSNYTYDSVTNEFLDIDVGTRSSSTFFDLDGSGTNDLIIGEYRGGRLLYKNYTESFWAGGTDGDWHTPSNWMGNEVPDSSTEIIIPGGLATYPSISSDANCESINLNTGATITVISGTLTISGDGN